jgi:hypothetical protein
MSHAANVARAPVKPWLRVQEGTSMKALRILVVEDDVTIGGLLAETLEDLGHVVAPWRPTPPMRWPPPPVITPI